MRAGLHGTGRPDSFRETKFSGANEQVKNIYFPCSADHVLKVLTTPTYSRGEMFRQDHWLLFRTKPPHVLMGISRLAGYPVQCTVESGRSWSPRCDPLTLPSSNIRHTAWYGVGSSLSLPQGGLTFVIRRMGPWCFIQYIAAI